MFTANLHTRLSHESLVKARENLGEKGPIAYYIWDEEFKYDDYPLIIDRKTRRNCMKT